MKKKAIVTHLDSPEIKEGVVYYWAVDIATLNKHDEIKSTTSLGYYLTEKTAESVANDWNSQ